MTSLHTGSPSDLHNIRERAFQMLCAMDLTEKQKESSLEPLKENMKDLFLAAPANEEGETQESLEKGAAPSLDEEFCAGSCVCWQCSMEVFHSACMEVEGVLGQLPQIDALIMEHAVNWKPDRMSAVDRTLIRLAVYEAIIAQTAPVAVAINEAVNLAKTYGSDESGRFVNGVLAKIVRERK